MAFFKYLPSCSLCEYADLYIPYYSFRYSDPYCSKGHGKCKEDKVCDDFRLINSKYCYECKYCFKDEYCNFHNKKINSTDEACVYFEKKNGGELE